MNEIEQKSKIETEDPKTSGINSSTSLVRCSENDIDANVN